MTLVSEQDIINMIKSKDCIKYPKDLDIVVKKRGEHELK